MEQTNLTRMEGAKFLRIGLSSFDRLLKRKNDPIPCLRVGHKIIIPMDALSAWIARQTENGLNN